jgi:anti-sigma factor RsiW
LTKCTDIRRNLIDLLDGSLSGECRADFDVHLAGCPACQRLVAAYQPLFEKLADRALTEPPRELWYKLQDQINRMEEDRPSRLRLPIHWRPVISLSIRSFGLVAALAIGIYLGNSPTETQASSEDDLLDYYATSLTQSSYGNVSDVIYQVDETGGNGQ